VRTVKPTARDARALAFPPSIRCGDGEGNQIFRKQAKKAERMARAISDAEAAESLSNLAEAYRKQADVLKAKRKSSKKRP
jgi:hypothetical protein